MNRSSRPTILALVSTAPHWSTFIWSASLSPLSLTLIVVATGFVGFSIGGGAVSLVIYELAIRILEIIGQGNLKEK